jgi:chromate reductase
MARFKTGEILMTTYNPIWVLGLSGNLRRDSNKTALKWTAAELMPPGMTQEIFDLSHLPMFNQDFE